MQPPTIHQTESSRAGLPGWLGRAWELIVRDLKSREMPAFWFAEFGLLFVYLSIRLGAGLPDWLEYLRVFLFVAKGMLALGMALIVVSIATGWYAFLKQLYTGKLLDQQKIVREFFRGIFRHWKLVLAVELCILTAWMLQWSYDYYFTTQG